MSIEKILSEYLRVNRCSQQEAAEQIGVSQTAFHNWLSGKSYPSGIHLKKIYEICNIPFESKQIDTDNAEINLLRKLVESQYEQIAYLKEKVEDFKRKSPGS
ncbi:helix-turn-helix domain-containing protein [Emticicia sp. CRIBPO]|uniref:helix-turn-helix domain-containing protein n=1 Tax=Emticicia sp. CRIBPO TaxID=2683258 RepID=UPI001412AFD8|nr:helix-turn-helix transcriptional regulator [Emticicia sp. CRIBPO]NBA88717.1 helix-turn-helix domain-containing protein [Emticicia sp. CRIBPO]